jgi:hypothetical protein
MNTVLENFDKNAMKDLTSNDRDTYNNKLPQSSI